MDALIVLMSFLPLILFSLIFAIFSYKVAEKTGKSKGLYVFVTIIPFVGTLFLVYLLYSTILLLLDEVNALKRVNTAK